MHLMQGATEDTCDLHLSRRSLRVKCLLLTCIRVELESKSDYFKTTEMTSFALMIVVDWLGRGTVISPQVANLWLIIIGGSLINKLDAFVNKPSSIVDLLGSSVPAKAQVNAIPGFLFFGCT